MHHCLTEPAQEPVDTSNRCDLCEKKLSSKGYHVLLSSRMKYEYHACSNTCMERIAKIVNPIGLDVQAPVSLEDIATKGNAAVDAFNAAIWKAKRDFDSVMDSLKGEL